jgi:hypothetical protein
MRNTSGIGNGSHGSRIRSDHLTAGAACLTVALLQKSATVAAVESASNHRGGSKPILLPVTASVTPREPKDNQIAIPAPTAVMRIRTDTPRISAAYVKRICVALDHSP